MNRIAGLLSRLVLAAPAVVVVAVVALTGLLAAVSADAEYATGNEGFAPENPELLAMDTIGERFGSSGEHIVQVLVEGDEVVGADGLTAVERITGAIRESLPASYLADTPERPAVVHWLTPVQQALADRGIDPDAADNAAVEEAFAAALTELPPEQSALLAALLPADVTLDVATQADSGLLLVFLDAEEVAPGTLSDIERWDATSAADRRLADAVDATSLPEGFSADAFSFTLLVGDGAEVQAELGQLFTAAFLIILLILAFVYWVRPGVGGRVLPGIRRTVADVVLTMAALVMAIVWMNGIGVLLGPGYLGWIGAINDVSQLVPVLLIGLGVDYAIHLTSRYRQEVAGGSTVQEAIAGSGRTVGVALVLATVTTAVGFLTNVLNPVPALGDFGVLAAVGIVASFLLMLTFVPAVRFLLDRRAARRGTLPYTSLGNTSNRLLPGLVSRFGVLAERAPLTTLAVAVLVGGALGLGGLSQLEVRFTQTDFVPDDTRAVALHGEIIDRYAGGFGETTDVLVTGAVDTPEAHNALVRALADLADIPDISTFGEVAQVESPIGLLDALLEPGDGRTVPPSLRAAATDAGLGADQTVAANADVSALYDALYAAAPDETGRMLSRDGTGGFDALRMTIQTRAGESRVAALRADLDEVFAPVVAAGTEVTPTSDEIITDVIATALSDSQVSSMLITLGAAMLLLMLTYWFRDRRPALGVITVLPVALVVLWTFALMAVTDIPFGPLTATIAALAIGIGVPYTVHITNRYQEDRSSHSDPGEAIRSTLRHTGGALAGSAFTTCAGFGILISSAIPAFRQFGLVTVYAIGFAFLAATLVLPSMLTLWDRWHRRRQPRQVVDAFEPEVRV